MECEMVGEKNKKHYSTANKFELSDANPNAP
jgi:hypothetical protein